MTSSTSQLYVPMNMNEFGAGQLQHQSTQSMLQGSGQAQQPINELRRHSSTQWDPQIPTFVTRPYELTGADFNSPHLDVMTMMKTFAPSPSVMQLYEATPASTTTAPMTRAVPLLDYQPPCTPISESTPSQSLYSSPRFISPQPLYPSEQLSANAERRASYATSYTTPSPGVHSQPTPPPMPLAPFDDTTGFVNLDTSSWSDAFAWDGLPQPSETPPLSFNEGSPSPEVVYPIPFNLDFSQIPEDQRPEFFNPEEYELVRLPCMPSGMSPMTPEQLQPQQNQQDGTIPFVMGSGLDGWYGGSTVGAEFGLGFQMDPMVQTPGFPYFENPYEKAQREADAIMATCVSFEDLKADGRKRKQQLIDAAIGAGGKISKSSSRKSSPNASSSAPKPVTSPRPPRRRTTTKRNNTKAATANTQAPTVQVA